jgi:hypothetical protein
MLQGEYLVLKKGESSGVSFPDPDGLRNGTGLRVWANGNRYEGSFRDDSVHGHGSLQKFEGGKYSGEFRNGERNGMGLEVRGAGRGGGGREGGREDMCVQLLLRYYIVIVWHNCTYSTAW